MQVPGTSLEQRIDCIGCRLSVGELLRELTLRRSGVWIVLICPCTPHNSSEQKPVQLSMSVSQGVRRQLLFAQLSVVKLVALSGITLYLDYFMMNHNLRSIQQSTESISKSRGADVLLLSDHPTVRLRLLSTHTVCFSFMEVVCAGISCACACFSFSMTCSMLPLASPFDCALATASISPVILESPFFVFQGCGPSLLNMNSISSSVFPQVYIDQQLHNLEHIARIHLPQDM